MRVQSDKPAKSGGWLHSQRDRQCLLPPVSRPAAPPRHQPPTINAVKLMREWAAATTATALTDFATALGVSTTSLVAVGAAWAAPRAAWAFPMCDGYGNIVGIRLRNERGKFAVRGSKQGIFLADVPAQKTLFVCEGPTDTAAAVGARPVCCGSPELLLRWAGHQGLRPAS